MRFRLFVLPVVLLTVAVVAMAQPKGRSQWTAEMLEVKHQMLVEEVGLSPAQQEKFMPLYEQMEQELLDVNTAARGLAAEVQKKSSPSDADYQQAVEALSSVKVKEGEIEQRYMAQYAKILTKKQLFQLKMAEAKFSRNMLKRRHAGNRQPKQ